MNRTFATGGLLLGVGFFTYTKFAAPTNYNKLGSSLGAISMFVGGFLFWNGYVSNYNEDPDFAILG